MKYWFLSAFLFFHLSSSSQNLQLHYDFRGVTDPKNNPKNFPTFSFEYFKKADTLKTGSFLLKLDTQLDGKHGNEGQVFIQISQSFRFWKPGIYLSLNYSGGLGVKGDAFGYYLYSSFGAGPAFESQWQGIWIAASLYLRVSAFDKPSYDPQFNIYFGKEFLNYLILTEGSFVFWTQNRNEGYDPSSYAKGKKFAFFGDPQVWFRIRKKLSLGSRINVFYHLLTENNQVQFYPTLGVRFQF